MKNLGGRQMSKVEKSGKFDRKVRKEKAITLIALVITIALNCLRSGRKLECVA